MKKIAIIGGGSWGTALAIVLTRSRQPHRISVWVHDPVVCESLRGRRVNEVYLPGFELPSEVDVTAELGEALREADIVVGVMPSAHARGLYTRMLSQLDPRMIFVSATKGLENKTLERMTEVISQVVSLKFTPRVAALSGPSFARENVVAIAAGVCAGLGFGSNTVAALITRGLAEMTRLACALGGRRDTLAGLAGMGDLVLTCTGALSRNRTVGVELGKGRPLSEILGSMRMVAEGVGTTAAAVELARKVRVEMPITEQMHAVLYQGRAPRDAIRELMERRLKHE